MTFDTFDAVVFTAGFLVPGFVCSAILSMLVPRRSSAPEARFLEFLTLSCLNNGFWSWAIFIIVQSGFIRENPYWSGLLLFGIIFVSPVVLGLGLGFLQQSQAVARFLRRFGFRTIHPTPTAWDWRFSRARPCWATVTLKNGSRVLGLFGYRSFAGDDPQGRDIYLEATYRLLPNGEWAPVEDTAGVLIMADQIAAIESVIWKRWRMAKDKKPPTHNLQEGYQPQPLELHVEQKGYQPQGTQPLNPQTLKPPKGDTAILPPPQTPSK